MLFDPKNYDLDSIKIIYRYDVFEPDQLDESLTKYISADVSVPSIKDGVHDLEFTESVSNYEFPQTYGHGLDYSWEFLEDQLTNFRIPERLKLILVGLAGIDIPKDKTVVMSYDILEANA